MSRRTYLRAVSVLKMLRSHVEVLYARLPFGCFHGTIRMNCRCVAYLCFRDDLPQFLGLALSPSVVDRLTSDPHDLSGRGDRPTVLDEEAETKSTLGGERSVTVHDECPSSVV